MEENGYVSYMLFIWFLNIETYMDYMDLAVRCPQKGC